MSARAGVATSDSAPSAAPYAPSWVDRLVAWLDRLPGPAWLTYLALGAIGIVVGNAISWLEGDPLTLTVYWSVFGLFPVAELRLIRHLDRVAADALQTFRPLLNPAEAPFAELERRFTTLPAGPAAIFTIAWVGFGLGADLQDPAAHRLVGIEPLPAILILGIEVAINGLLGAYLLKATRHFLDVARIHREAPRIDLFEPAPLYAFSRLTSQTAVGILFLAAVLVPSLAPTYFSSDADVAATTRAGFVSMIVGMIVAATAMFVLPLYGMHRRIVIEKERLQTASGARLTAVLAELDHDVTSGDLTRADGLNKLLASVLAERDVLVRLPTWPWQAATLRAFVSALILPVLVYVLARAAERVVL